MSYRSALACATLLGAAFIADMVLNDGRALLFLLRKLVDLTIYLSFWR